MKCRFCSNEPTHVCLVCGVFYCDQHGKCEELEILSPKRFKSVCQNCVERAYKQYKVLGWVFGFWGLGLAVAGAALWLTLLSIMAGVIFIVQGVFFLYLGVRFMATNATGEGYRN